MTVKTSMICLLNKDLKWDELCKLPQNRFFFAFNIHEISTVKNKQINYISFIYIRDLNLPFTLNVTGLNTAVKRRLSDGI